MSDSIRRSSFSPGVYYKDPLAALEWLEKAFGFERSMVITDQDGRLAHGEMRFGDSYLHVGSAWADYIATPDSVGAKNTQTVHVQLENGIDDHCERAQKAGAVVIEALSDQFYGDRTYRVRDPEGHVWTFGQTVRQVTREEAVAVTGLTIDGWH